MVTGLWLLWQRARFGNAWLWFGMGGVLGLAAVYGPFLLLVPEAFYFANSFHTARDTGGGLLLKAGSLSRVARGYMPLAMLSGVLVMTALVRRRDAAVRDPRTAEASEWPMLWLLIFLAVFGVHLASPYPYDDYQVPVMPLLAAVAAVWLFRGPLLRAVSPLRCAWVALMVAAVAAFASPINQDWFVIRQDRFWAITKTRSDLALLRDVGRRVRESAPSDKPLLTQDTYLAVEAGRRVPPGFEIGAFGYFPELSDAQAAHYRVLNRRGLERALMTTDAPLAAFSGYTFSMGAPAMRQLPEPEQDVLWRLVRRRYRPVMDAGIVPDFGQNHTTLTLWQLRDLHGDAP
jgi:hypothetical protein